MNSIEVFEQFLDEETEKAKNEFLKKSTRSVVTTNYCRGYYDAMLTVWENFQWLSDEYHEGEI